MTIFVRNTEELAMKTKCSGSPFLRARTSEKHKHKGSAVLLLINQIEVWPTLNPKIESLPYFGNTRFHICSSGKRG
jgi:hypothetical protein